MGTQYQQLSLEERCKLARLHEDGHSIRKIAANMDRAASTISRELKRNRDARKTGYRPVHAQERAWARRWRGSRMARQPEVRHAHLTKLAMGWSPEQVAGRLALEEPSMAMSAESIYRFIYAQIRRTNDYSWRFYLPRAKSKRGYRKPKGTSSALHIKNRVSIAKRPSFIARRKQPGHWETDLLMFGNKRDNILATQERCSRFILLAKQKDKKASRTAKTLQRWFAAMPEGLRRTLTQDNGVEFAHHYKLNEPLGIKTFFCDPHSPWQKGGIENINARLRRYLPLKTDLQNLTHAHVQDIANRLNNTPRKCLGFKTPAEVFSKHLLHFKCESTFRLSPE